MPPRVRPATKFDERLRDFTGVRRRLERDGLGREAWWWFASAVIKGRQRTRRWSVDKHGDCGAWRLALAQRRDWEQYMSRNHLAKPLWRETRHAQILGKYFGFYGLRWV